MTCNYWFTTSNGRIELNISLDDALSGSHPGQCDDDVKSLSDLPYIREQLDKIDPGVLVDELLEYGAWDRYELIDHETNLQRILWLACGDIREESTNEDQKIFGYD